MADNLGPLADVTAETMAAEVHALGRRFRFDSAAAGLAHTPVLALTADDGLAPNTDALVRLIQSAGLAVTAIINRPARPTDRQDVPPSSVLKRPFR
jgi:hypothetical protein